MTACALHKQAADSGFCGVPAAAPEFVMQVKRVRTCSWAHTLTDKQSCHACVGLSACPLIITQLD